PNCSVRFGYGTTSQAIGDFLLYDTVTAWVAGYTQGQNPYLDIDSLNDDDDYYFRVQIMNEHSTVTSTTEQTFHTSATLDDPTDFQGQPGSTNINLSWVRGEGTSNVLIRYATDDYPATVADGTQIYFDSGSGYNHTGLSGGTTYYYTIWGESGGVYSSVGGVNLAMTTYASIPTGDELEAPTTPFGWYQDPDYTLLENLEPFYSVINNFADDWEMPRNNMWTGIILMICMSLTLGTYIKVKAPALSLLVLCLMLAGAVALHLLASFWIFFAIISGAGAWATRPQGM
ncbi:MAG: fibronectin type III domain-containing protein, partial [Sideroxydans sp.]|nr:fibronectin type III domain-containing protein [Sideroxydans sp.]